MTVAKKSTQLTPAAIITRRRNAVLDRQGYISLLSRVVLLALCVWIFLTQLFLITQFSGNDMFPAVKDGDLIIGYRLQREYAVDDIIVFTQGGKTRIGRIVAQAGDTVTLSESGIININGTNIAGEIIYPTYPREGAEEPYTVPDGCVYVLGDYRTQCEDSRDFGGIRLEAVQAKVITLLRRRGL